MTNICFWNVKNKDLGNLLLQLCMGRGVDILIIAEPWKGAEDFAELISRACGEGYFYSWGGNGRLLLISRLAFSSIKPKADALGVMLVTVDPGLGAPFLLGGMHLPSKLFFKGIDQAFHCRSVVDLIQQSEKDLGSERTLLIGDFNMDPFENGMIAATAFHAVMDRRVARRGSRRVAGRDFGFFYNPMWSRLGDSSKGPPGTFKWSGSTYAELFWRSFDQILVRPELLDSVDDSHIEVIEAVGNVRLVQESGRWNCPSDHLPILASVRN